MIKDKYKLFYEVKVLNCLIFKQGACRPVAGARLVS